MSKLISGEKANIVPKSTLDFFDKGMGKLTAGTNQIYQDKYI